MKFPINVLGSGYRARINNLTSRNLFRRHIINDCASLTGEEGSMLNLCQLVWCNWACCSEITNRFPTDKELLGTTLGPDRGEGN